nr:E-beta-farnesene synthase [Tanacetum cinerariifolium]
MADVNVNAPADQAPTMAPPTCSDDQILTHIRWVPIGKSNYYLDVEKSQSNPIYMIAVDILKHTNFFRAFTASSAIPSIYIQQFWDTVRYDKTTSRFERPMAQVLQILWGFVNRAHINYVERIWEEFTQSIHTFIEDKKNLAQHTHGKKKATLIVILSIRFTKLIIYYLQRKHKFLPRPDSPLYLPNEEPVLGYLKFSAKGTKREVFRIPIPSNLITADIQVKPYYQEYLEKVAKHQRYLAGEQGSDPDSPAPKPAKATKKSKPSAPKADPRPPVTKPASSQQLEPKPAPTKSKGKKRKLVMETSDKPSPARRSKPGLVTKRRKPTNSMRSVDKSVAEGIPKKEPRFDDKEADVERELEESLKSIYDAPRGLLPPVSLDLLTLQMPKKKSPANQFIFQRRTSSPTGSSGHDESSSLYAELGLTDSEVESDEHVPGMDAGVQDEDQARPNPGVQDEGQAGPNPGLTATAYLKVHENLKLTVEEQVILEEPASSTGTLSSLQHLAKDLCFGDLFFNDKPSEADNEKTTTETEAESMVSVTIQQDTSSILPMTTPIIDLTSRPDSSNVHRPLQSTATENTTTTTTIHQPPPQPQQSTTYSMLMKRIGELEHIMVNLIQDNKHLEERDLPEADMKEILHQRMWETNFYKTHEDYMMLYEALEKSMKCDHSEELLKDLTEARKKKKKRHDSPKTPLGSPPHQPPPPPPPAGLSGTSGSSEASGSSQVPPPPPPPPSINQEGQSHGSAAPSSSKTAALPEYKAWITTNTRIMPSVSSTPKDLQMDDDMDLDVQVHLSDDEDIGNAHIPKVNLRQDWWKPLEEDRPATPEPTWSILSSDTGDMPMFMDWFCKRQGITELKPQDLKGPAFKLVKVLHPNVIHLQYQMEECHKLLTDSVDDSIIRHNVSKPLPLGGPPSQVTIQSDFFNKDLEYLRYGSKGSRPALLILKMKAAYYPDVGLEKMVPDQMWIEEECKYDIAAMYGISHWWFHSHRFYIDKHTSEGDRRVVWTHMRILSVVRIEVFSMYGYDYMKNSVLHRVDLNEHIVAERDFKYLYPSDFEDLYLLNLQGHLNHLPPKDKKILTTAINLWTRHLVIRQRVEDFQLGIESYQTQLNLTKPRWDATGFEYKHDYTIDEALDYRVKEFKVNRMNPGLDTSKKNSKRICNQNKDMDLEDEGSICIGDDVSKEKRNDVEEGLIRDNESIVEMNETELGKTSKQLFALPSPSIIFFLLSSDPRFPYVTKDGTLMKSTNLIITMPKFNNDKKDNKSLERMARISVRACCFINPPPSSLPYQCFSPPSDYQTSPLSTPLESPPTTPIVPPGFCSGQLLTTLKTSLTPLTSPPSAPTQPSKQTSPLAINLEPIELVFSTPPTSHPFFDSLEDLPSRTTNPPPSQPTFDSIECLANHPPPVPEITEMEPLLPPLPPQLPPHSQPMWSNDAFPSLTHELFCEYFQRTQMIINDLCDEIKLIPNHILERLTTLTYQNFL